MMWSDDESSERSQTNTSLRIERAKSDETLHAKLASIDATADEVIAKARTRADAVLARARNATDRYAAETNVLSLERTKQRRDAEDVTVNAERADADATLRLERTQRVAMLHTERDVTDLHLSSERLRSDADVATRDEFLGVVSHDLRNMLASVIGFASLIGTSMAQGRPDAIIDHAERIKRSGARMNRLVGDLLDIASIEAGALAVTRELSDASRVMMEAVESFQTQAASSNVTIVAEVPPHAFAAMDPARILQVLTNLISNAIKFTPTGGSIVARVERKGEVVTFTVRDTGIGIPEDKLETIFDRFQQVDSNDRRGVGLGLYISKCIVQGHGGRIWSESTLGKGSTFSFVIP